MKTRAIDLTRVLRETFTYIWRSDIKIFAGSLAFATILGIVPMLAVAFAAIQGLGYLDLGAQKIEPFIYENLAPAAGELVHEHLTRFLQNTRFGTIGIAGIIGLCVTTLLTFNQFTIALNRILGTTKKRRPWHTALKIIIFFTVAPTLVGLSLSITALLPFMQGELLALLVNTVALGTVYKILSHYPIPWSALLIATSTTAVLWELAKWAYAGYAIKAVNYSTLYGPLSALPLFFLWIYVAWFVVLTGAALIRTLINTKKENAK